MVNPIEIKLSRALVGSVLGGVTLAFAWAGPAGAEAQVTAPANDPAQGLMLSSERYRGTLGQPPAPGSRAEADDLAILRWNQRTRTPDSIAHSWSYLDRNPGRFSAAIGNDLLKGAPAVARGLQAFLQRVDSVKDELKDQLARPRPYVSHTDLRPCLPLENSASFPSGHATWYAAAAQLLADLLPERRERLLEVGRQGGFARASCGVHYPSDVLASQRLGEAIGRDVIASPQWRRFRDQSQSALENLLTPAPAGLPALVD
jgi:acid phosphatase (class A)